MRKYIFADESGCLTFNRRPNVSRFFILCTVYFESCGIGYELLDLRRELAWREYQLDDYLHAAEDRQIIRDEVFNFLRTKDFRVDATILEKSKALPRIRESENKFYHYAWFYHFKYVAPLIVSDGDELMISAASIGEKKMRAIFRSSINDVAQQCLNTKNVKWQTHFCPASTEPCLQIADYCAWAIQKKWEKGDGRSYDLIKDKIHSEFDLWSIGTTHYY